MKNIFLGIILTSVSVWTITRNLTIGWAGAIFFGAATIIFIVKYFNPNYKWIKNPNSKKFKEQTEKEFIEIYNVNGVFTFYDSGFTIKTTTGVQKIEWTEIKSMLGYKEDHFATDCICLDVFCDNNKSFKITEEMMGWFMFLENSKNALPTIEKSWEIKISIPAFETNLTLLYDRHNRYLSEVVTEYYK